MKSPLWIRILLISLTAALNGCGDSGPSRPAFDPANSAVEALATYDSNSDGGIDNDEVESSPGLKAAFASIDTNEDGTLSAEEIEARVNYYKSAPTTVIQGATRIIYKRKPLRGARVLFEPEPFLGSDFKPCEGTTDRNGIASVTGADAEFPGLYLGFYTVRVTQDKDGKQKIPAKYNEESTLGYEATDDQNMGLADIISFELK